MQNFNTKYIYYAPQICMYCKTCYGVKSGFNATHPTHGICNDCYPSAFAKMKCEVQGMNGIMDTDHGYLRAVQEFIDS